MSNKCITNYDDGDDDHDVDVDDDDDDDDDDSDDNWEKNRKTFFNFLSFA